jgi:hypothetical protein
MMQYRPNGAPASLTRVNACGAAKPAMSGGRASPLIAVNPGAASKAKVRPHRILEDAMSNPEEPKLRQAHLRRAPHFLSRMREWWRRRHELDAIDRCELERIAGDLGMSAGELKDLAARGPHAADRLHERMRLLGLTRADVDRLAHGLMWDLERTCARCNQNGRCEKDLATRPHDASWGGYCPNAVALTAVKNAMHHFPMP